MKGLSVILTIALLVLANQLATRMKPAAGLPAASLPGIRTSVLNSSANALATLNHAATIPHE
jgi:hypothetical protein